MRTILSSEKKLNEQLDDSLNYKASYEKTKETIENNSQWIELVVEFFK